MTYLFTTKKDENSFKHTVKLQQHSDLKQIQSILQNNQPADQNNELVVVNKQTNLFYQLILRRY